MFEYLEMSNISRKTGIESVHAKVDPYGIDEYGLCYGKAIALNNNHIKNTYEIMECRMEHGCNCFVRFIESGKDETKTINEFKKWLIDNDYSDKDLINIIGKTL